MAYLFNCLADDPAHGPNQPQVVTYVIKYDNVVIRPTRKSVRPKSNPHKKASSA